MLLAGLDLARPYVGPSLRPWQWLAGALVVAAFWAVLAPRAMQARSWLPAVALAAFLVPTLVDHGRTLESDGIHYYAYLRSLLFDADLQLANDYELLGWPLRGPNVLPIGAPLMWSPLVVTVHLLRQGARLLGMPAPNGVEPMYQAAACLASVLYGAAGLFLLQQTLRRWVTPAAAFWATVLVWVGTPLRFYLSVLPGLAHACEFFAAVLVLRAYLALRQRPDVRRAAWAGAACGLLFLVRSQDGLLLALPALELGRQMLQGRDRRGTVLAFLALGGAFVLAALPQIIVWQAMFGVPILIPHKHLHGDEFMHLAQPQLLGALLSPRGGLFVTHPVLLVAVGALVLLVRRDRRYALSIVPILLATWYVNSTVFDWYHVRRYTGIVPLLAPALALALVPLTRAGMLPVALLALLALRYDRAVDELRRGPGDPVPVRAALARTADSFASDTYSLVERVSPAAAVHGLAAFTGEALLADGVSTIDLTRDDGLMRLPFPARNLTGVEVEDGKQCRWVRGQDARLFLPLAQSVPVILTIEARPLETVQPQVMTVTWNGAEVGREAMPLEWRQYRFHVPASAVRAGTNVMALEFERGPLFRRMRGSGPAEVRAAALASVVLHRE